MASDRLIRAGYTDESSGIAQSRLTDGPLWFGKDETLMAHKTYNMAVRETLWDESIARTGGIAYQRRGMRVVQRDTSPALRAAKVLAMPDACLNTYMSLYAVSRFQRLAASSHVGVCVMDLAQGGEMYELYESNEPHSLCWSDDGTKLYFGDSEGFAYELDVPTCTSRCFGWQRKYEPHDAVRTVDVSGNTLMVGGRGAARLIDVRTRGVYTQTFPMVHHACVNALKMNRNSHAVAFGTNTSGLCVADLRRPDSIEVVYGRKPVKCVSWSPSQHNTLLFGPETDSWVSLRRLSGNPIWTFQTDAPVTEALWDTDGAHACLFTGVNWVDDEQAPPASVLSVLDVRDCVVRSTAPNNRGLCYTHCVASPDWQNVLIACAEDEHLSIFETTAVQQQKRQAAPVRGMCNRIR
jgi:WD40 repeat protein